MSIEKTIKSQSRTALSDNWITVVSGFFLVCAAALLVYLTGLISGYIGNIWDENGFLIRGNEIFFTVTVCLAVITAVLISPFKNGFYKLCYNISLTGNADFSDMFYFFKGNKYIITLEMNLIIALKALLRFVLGLVPYFIVKALTVFFSVELLTTVAANEIFSAVEIILLVIGAIAGVLLSIPLFVYQFAYIEFEDDTEKVFNSSKSIIKKYKKNFYTLFFSFIPWIAMCFFVLPAIYAVPYITTSFADSSKWLLKLYKENKI